MVPTKCSNIKYVFLFVLINSISSAIHEPLDIPIYTEPKREFNKQVTLEVQNEELILNFKQQDESLLKTKINFTTDDGVIKKDVLTDITRQFNEAHHEDNIVLQNDHGNLHINVSKGELFTNDGGSKVDGNCFTMTLKVNNPDSILSTCFDLEDGVNWFNAFEVSHQYWPMEKMNIEKRPLIPLEFDNQAIAEPYFLNSKGLFLYFDPKSTLHYSINNTAANTLNQFCIYTQKGEIYLRPESKSNYLKFTSCKYENSKVSQMKAMEYYLGKPSAMPDTKMIEHPIWTTWAVYKAAIDDKKVIEYAADINKHGFNNSQLEIDDKWENCYGSSVIDKVAFPNMKETIAKLKEMGFRVTMWIHPFVNKDCLPYFHDYERSNILSRNGEGDVSTSWWNSKKGEAAHFDFSKPSVAAWFIERLERLKNEIDVDSFKFDAGESTFAPQIPIQSCPYEDQPNCMTKAYVHAASKIGSMIEFRTGAQTQYLPHYVRMLDRNSFWDFRVGLPTLITATIMMNIAGYSFVMPDMIGGNIYPGQVCTEELFIRWVQANTFMPILQFSITPWTYGPKAVEVTKKYTELHYKYAGKIIEIMQNTVENGTPVNPPIWWVAPSDPEALACSDQYMLGEDILVAPVIVEGAVTRDIYLPAGEWRDEADPKHPVITGPKWLKKYPAPLDVLPYFTKVSAGQKL